MNIKTYIRQNRPLAVRKGKHTLAYIYSDRVLLCSNDSIKECMALGWFPSSLHLPTVRQSSLTSSRAGYYVYEMDLYTTGRGIKSLIIPRDYTDIYLPLRELQHIIQWDCQKTYNWHNNFITAVERSCLTGKLQSLLIECYEACMNYSHKVRFEISPRNVAANSNSRLILLDCFYIAK